eukprot:1113243_1
MSDAFAYYTYLEVLFDYLIVPCLVIIKTVYGIDVLYGNKVDPVILLFNQSYCIILCGSMIDCLVYQICHDICDDVAIQDAYDIYCKLDPQPHCPICHDCLDDDVMLLGCGHVFHRNCLAQYSTEKCCYCGCKHYSWWKWKMTEVIQKNSVPLDQLVRAQIETRWQQYCGSMHCEVLLGEKLRDRMRW